MTAAADVLLHVTCLRRDGYQTAYEGARIVVEALNRPGGLQAFRILSMDESTARHPAQMPAARTHVQVEPTSKLERLEVKWFNRMRGFGFLSAGEGHPDIFVHMETLRRFGMTELRPGQFVLARYGDGPKGLMVAEIRPDGWGEAPPRTDPAMSNTAPTARKSPLIIAVSVVVLALLAVAAWWVLSPSTPQASETTVLIETGADTHAFIVEVVDTDATRSRGLMFREELAPDAGMLFDFIDERPVSFWMENTFIPLDMIFANRTARSSGCTQTPCPRTGRPIPSGEPVQFVLEIPGGRAAELGIEAGDTLIHPRAGNVPD